MPQIWTINDGRRKIASYLFAGLVALLHDRSSIMTIRHFAFCAFAALGTLALQGTAAHALTMQECSTKYKAAQTAGTLNGQKWNDFRKAECGTDAAATTAAKSTKSKTKPATPVATGDAVFSTKYASESASKARMHTCLDQYNANKTNNANGGLTWIKKGGGYYSVCNKKLKG